MRTYIIRRLLALIPTLILATLIIFFLIRMIPGHVIDLMMSQQDVSADKVTRQKIEKELGLDVPVHVQYVRWMGRIVHGDLGHSLWRQTDVWKDIKERIPVTFELSVFSLAISLIFAIPIGVYSAVRQDTMLDYLGRTVSILGVAVPYFWVATMIMVYPALWWGWSPPVELIRFSDNPIGNIKMFLIPSAVLGLLLSAVTMRMMRAMMLEVLRNDYVRTAWAKGAPEKIVITRHALKNALIPVVTLIGIQVPILVGGSVVIEQIFALPGIGLLLLDAVNQRDYPIITGLVLVIGIFVLLINLLVDLSYGLLDPKVRYQ
ncbi:MAG: ABC transporter permease [Desulfobacteraceae bacterium]|nr:MAG: ABC transporter permease [Desulfobacteraceae bacterium]